MLYIIRGLPEPGKSTLGRKLCPNHNYAADDFMGDVFDHRRLAQCHQACREIVYLTLGNGHDVAVCNTFVQRWEMQPYLKMPGPHTIISLFDQGLTDSELASRCTHGVPVETIARMRAKYA